MSGALRHARILQAAIVAAICAGPLAAPGLAHAALVDSGDSGVAARGSCAPGALTLAPAGSHLYPDTGNGGYVSKHTSVHMVYNSATNRFLPGNHVVLTDIATRCLTSFGLDLERTSGNKPDGPRLTVTAVTVNGEPASFAFVQPAYPGDPAGPADPNPAAHEASQTDPVGGPQDNPLPPACSPELLSTSAQPDSLDGTQCPANKLVITPSKAIRRGSRFTVSVSYTGRPGVHNDGDGTTEGWFRSPDGGFVTTEPVGSEDWMPLNDYPTAKPSYDYYDTVPAGKTAVGNGQLISDRSHGASAEFPHGSVTWHWRETAPVASYLVEDSVGNFKIRSYAAANGVRFYQVQDTAISAKQQRKNRAIMNRQQNITEFESQFNGAYPFSSDGVIIGLPQASFEEEMETMITFAGGTTDTDTLYHENMHQWWGDNVTEASYAMTFYKEGLATLAEYLFSARQAEAKAWRSRHVPRAGAAFQRSLEQDVRPAFLLSSAGFRTVYAPSDPTPATLFGDNSYDRPGSAYVALRQILGHGNFTRALQAIQRHYRGANITEPQLEAAFARWLPNHSAACQARLGEFFTQWFDTAYPGGGGTNRPQISAPGLPGPDFYGAGGCTR